MEPVAHEDAVPQFAEHLGPIFESSPDGVYVWLDHYHWTCNERPAQMFGFTVAELEDTPDLLQRRVHEDDQELLSSNYWDRVRRLASPVTFRFRGVRKDGSAFGAETDMIPLTYGGHTIAYHFVRAVGD